MGFEREDCQSDNKILFIENKESNKNTECALDNIPYSKELSIKEMVKKISSISIPTILFFICIYLQQVINLIFIGNEFEGEEKKKMIDAIGISNLYTNCFLLSLASGLVSGFETLGSNAYGAQKYKLLGTYFHRSQLISLLFVGISLVIHYFFAMDILSFFHFDSQLTDYIHDYLFIQMLYVLCDAQFSVNFRYLNIIGQSYINLASLGITLALHPLWCYLLINVFKMGVQGAAVALLISQFINAALGSLYILIKNPLPESLFFYNRDSFRGWCEYLKISIPATVLMCAEWWAFECLAVIAYWASPEDYTVHVLIANLQNIFYCIGMGFGASAAIVVGKYISEGNLVNVKKARIVNYLFALAWMLTFVTTVFIFRKQVLKMFGEDEEILEVGTPILTLLCVGNLFDFSQSNFSGVCRGLRKQFLASLLAILNLYIIQLGLAYLFALYLEMGVYGVWLGAVSSYAIMAFTYLFVMLCFDLNKIKLEIQAKIEHDNGLLENSKKLLVEENAL